MKIAIVEWEAWDNFLLPYIFKDAERISVDPFSEASARTILDAARRLDLVCFQINLSIMSDLPLSLHSIADALRSSDVQTVNALCQNISKHELHGALARCGLPSLRLTKPTTSSCLAIIKSALNYGGVFEKKYRKRIPPSAKCAPLVRDDLGPYSYQVLPANQVPAYAFEDDSIVIERYINNTDDCFYRLYFAGSNRVVVKAHCAGHIKKICGDDRDINYGYSADNSEDALEILPAPILDIGSVLPAAMKAEYGCIDIVANDDGECYAVDFNSTPHAGLQPPQLDVLDFMRAGLVGIVERSRRSTKPD